jgi:hypothetical protein
MYMSQFNPLLQSQEPIYYEMSLPSNGIPYFEDNSVDEIFEPGALSKEGIVQVRALFHQNIELLLLRYL